MIILAIDPGNKHSAFVVWDSEKQQMLDKDKLNNKDFFDVKLKYWLEERKIDEIAIEMISSYGLAVGQETFDTCIFVGMIITKCREYFISPKLIFRKTIKMHHCHSVRAKDAEVNIVLKQKYGDDNTIKNPNKIYWNEFVEKNGGNKYMNGDIWAAFALALYICEPKDYPITNIMEKEINKLSPFLYDFILK